ncbi:Scr1 family TA system antitoxin-like transcriptional regulator [Streptomyces malaysiensis]|uniref:Scr1 family TA system antitoxin-like transcriptional regulator n=1 Tax=Streptomyces malaysiensis TaxID=92644 RepID=UPI001FCE2CC9|nr:Scr1 family TA system antitoxin-like transcriptional regulator [Streptomyces malaysiensis]
MLDIAELEQDASGLRVALAVHIPGLLQTVDHARALYRETVPALEPYHVQGARLPQSAHWISEASLRPHHPLT